MELSLSVNLLVLAFLCQAAIIFCQDALESFDEVRDALQNGDVVQLYLSVASCPDATGLLKDRDVSITLRQWRYQSWPDGSSPWIEAFDYFVTPVEPDASMMWVVRKLNMTDNGAVSFTISSIGAYGDYPVEQLASFQCDLGSGARVFRTITGVPLEAVDSYQEMKAAFLAGDDIHAIAYLSECSSAFLPPDTTFVVGFHSLIFDVIDDGTGNGLILFDDLPILDIDPMMDNAVYDYMSQVISYENGMANVRVTIWNFDLDLLSTIYFDCEIGSSLKFSAAQKATPVVLETFQEIKEAALKGHDIEVSSLLHFCEKPGPEGVIVTAKSTHFELVEGGVGGEERERIIFHGWGLDSDGLIYSDVLYIYEDEQLFYEAFNVAPSAGPEGLNYFPLMCPLGTGGRVQAIPRERKESVTSLEDIQTAIATSGQVFEIAIDFNGCQAGDNYMAGTVMGGVGWQILLKSSDDDSGKDYIAHIFAMITREIGDGLRSPAYDVTRVILKSSPDGSGDQVLVQKGIYDWYTGENVLGQGDGMIECELAAGSVQIYPYYP